MDEAHSNAPVTLSRLRDRKEDILAVARQHHTRGDIWVFGSVARGQADASSDVDLLVTFDDAASLFDLVSLSDELAELLGVPVDVMSASAHGVARDRATAQAVRL